MKSNNNERHIFIDVEIDEKILELMGFYKVVDIYCNTSTKKILNILHPEGNIKYKVCDIIIDETMDNGYVSIRGREQTEKIRKGEYDGI